MKRISALVAIVFMLLALATCAENEAPAADSGQQADTETNSGQQSEGEMIIYADTGKTVLEIEPADNSSAEAFVSLLEKGDLTVDMHDYGGFEKVGPIGSNLPTNDENITTEPGDVILYQGDQITIYYDTNTWDFTRLGKVRNLSQSELKEALGDGDVRIVFSLNKGSSANATAGEFDFELSDEEMEKINKLDKNEKHEWY